jgi:hypothetical protein
MAYSKAKRRAARETKFGQFGTDRPTVEVTETSRTCGLGSPRTVQTWGKKGRKKMPTADAHTDYTTAEQKLM